MRLTHRIDRTAFALALVAFSASQAVGCNAEKSTSIKDAPPLTTTADARGGGGAGGGSVVAPTLAVGATDGEFTVGQSGDASYTLGLNLVGGTAGIQPDIRLAYESSGGDSPLGVGWSLSSRSLKHNVRVIRCAACIGGGNDESRAVMYTSPG
jgi:virulence plasmid B protein